MKGNDNIFDSKLESELKKDSKSTSKETKLSFDEESGSNRLWPEITAEELAAAQALMEEYSPSAATEKDRQRFGTITGPELVDLSEAQRKEMLLSGRRVLREQMADLKESSIEVPTAAKSAEKVLFLSDSKWHRWIAAEDLMVAHSKHGLTKITKSTNKRTLEGLLGYVPDTVSALRRRRDALPEVGSRGRQFFNLLLALLALGVIVLLQVHPTLTALFTEDNVYQALLVIGSIITIIMFFVGGLWGSIIFLVVYALVVVGLQMIIPLAILGKLLVLLIFALIAFLGFRGFSRQSKKLKYSVRKRRAEEVAALRADAARLRNYANTLTRQVDEFLKEDEAGHGGRDDESKQHHYEIRVYIRQYRDKVQEAMRELENSLPTA